MRSYRWDGVVTALSSVAHGGEALGTVTYLRREKFLLPSGLVEEIPVVSGNAVRGLIRDAGAALMWERLGSPALPLPVMHALWAGGALVKAKGEPLSGHRLARLRRTVPHIGVFGAAGGGRIIDGALQVGKMLPVCQQTAHVLPESLSAGPLPDIWDLVQVESYSRMPNADRLPEVVQQQTPPVDGSEVAESGSDGRMRYGVETFIAGTRFHWWMGLTNATAAEKSFFDDVLARYSEHAVVGGRLARGHGQLRLDVTERCLDGEPETAVWHDLGGASDAEVTEVLGWLN